MLTPPASSHHQSSNFLYLERWQKLMQFSKKDRLLFNVNFVILWLRRYILCSVGSSAGGPLFNMCQLLQVPLQYWQLLITKAALDICHACYYPWGLNKDISATTVRQHKHIFLKTPLRRNLFFMPDFKRWPWNWMSSWWLYFSFCKSYRL